MKATRYLVFYVLASVPLFNVTARGQNRGTAAPAPSKWVRSIDKSLLDDSKIVALSLAAEIPVQGWLNTVTPRLIIRCKENETSVYVNTGMSASVELNGHTVRIRLGTKPAVTEKWEESTDNKALFSPSPIDFARRIAATTSLIFEFTPFSANPVVTRFDVRGLKLDEISATCNWAKYDEAARQRAQQAKLGVLRLDTPLEIEGGISIPVPYGATPRIQGDPPQHITICACVSMITIGYTFFWVRMPRPPTMLNQSHKQSLNMLHLAPCFFVAALSFPGLEFQALRYHTCPAPDIPIQIMACWTIPT